MQMFKPFRNYLRQFNCASFLEAIWHLTTHLEFGMALPSYLASANPYGRGQLQLGFFLWELDTLSREVILHCDLVAGKPVNEWRQIVIAINMLRKLEEDAGNIDEYNVMSEMTRIAHRQFHWQEGISSNDLIRTRKLYRNPGIDEAVAAVYGLPAERVALAGFSALATFMKHFAITDDFPENAANTLKFNPRSVLEHLTLDISELRKRTMSVRSLDANWAYAFNPLWRWPLIRMGRQGRWICPFPGLLGRRMMEGLYFDVGGHNQDVLSEHLGPAFQAYIGEVFQRANKGRFEIFKEETYRSKKMNKDTVDWIVRDGSASLFVEVKVMKMGKAAKELLAPADPVTAQFAKLAKAIGQVYTTLTDAKQGKYPGWKPDGRPIIPLIVTLDDWCLFTHHANHDLDEQVFAELDRRGVARDIVKEHQYVVCASNELESAIQVMHEVGIHEVMRELTEGSRIGWLFWGHLQSGFSDELRRVRPLFPEEKESFWPGRI